MANSYIKYHSISGPLVFIGFGSIGRGTMPLVERHFIFDSKNVFVIDPNPQVQEYISIKGVNYIHEELTIENYKSVLDKIFINEGEGFCINLSVDTSSRDLIQYCQQKNILYVDTVIEEWKGFYSDTNTDIALRTNYNLRERLKKFRSETQLNSTAVSCCGANPGMVNWFVKQALLNLAKDLGILSKVPNSREEWAALMAYSKVKGIHIAERDTQIILNKKPADEFWNTWSVEGFISEGFYQPSELGWGTHEKTIPLGAQFHSEGCKSAIYLNRPGMNTMVKTWCPTLGAQYSFLVTHNESISIADYFTLGDKDNPKYRPTCHYAYHPCDDAVISSLESIGKGQAHNKHYIYKENEIHSGIDELGVLLYGHDKNAYWYGSQLSNSDTIQLAPYQNATGLQVTSAVLAGMVWAIENPKKGLVDTDEMDFQRCLEVQAPYIQPVKGFYTDWNPLMNTFNKNDNSFDLEDPWQFSNILLN